MNIDHSFSSFLHNLGKNNNREWFAEHKTEYENDVRIPFIKLIGDLRDALISNKIQLKDRPEQIILRINRDLRFSKDKTPYHTLLKAIFVSKGRKSGEAGFYMGIDAKHLHVGGGLYQPPASRLQSIREHILKNPTSLQNISNLKIFKQLLGNISGEQAKRLKQPFQAELERLPTLANKEFIAMAEVPVDQFSKARNQTKFILKYFMAVQPLVDFLNQN